MPSIAHVSLTAGLHSGAGEGGPDHVADALNVFSGQSRLVKRQGMIAIRAMSAGITRTKLVVGSGVGTTEPTSGLTAYGGTHAMGATHTTIYAAVDPAVVAASTFNRLILNGLSTYGVSTRRATTIRDLVIEYWNGTAWTAIDGGWVWKPYYDATNDDHTIYPFVLHDEGNGGTNRVTDDHVPICIDTPPDWATKVIAGTTSYWLRIRGFMALDGATINNSGATPPSWCQITENRILHVNTWRDAQGAPHEFVVYLVGTTGTTIQYVLDGVQLSQAASLSVDGASKMFSPRTKVDSFFHPATNRLIGRVSGLGWFFLIPGNAEIYWLNADDGIDTPYASLTRGIRAAIPIGEHVAFHDGRLFSVAGQRMQWSAAGVYADVWPNEFENPDGLVDGLGDVTGLATFARSLIVFKRSGIYSMQVVDDDVYAASPYPGGVGALGGIASAGNFVVFLSDDGLWMFDGENLRRLSGAVDGFFVGDVPFSSEPQRVKAVFNTANNQYRLFYSSTGESLVYDRALYVDLTGYTYDVSGEEKKDVSFWPQGRYSATDYGFMATAVHQDTTTNNGRTLIGDKYGVLWECDSGNYDAGSSVKAYAQQIAQNVGGRGQALVRNVTSVIKNTGDKAWTLRVINDNDRTNEQSVSVNAYLSADTASNWSAASTFAAGTTFGRAGDVVTIETPVEVRCRNFAIRLEHLLPGQMEWIAHDMVASPVGGKGER